jgi:hypothetical protein
MCEGLADIFISHQINACSVIDEITVDLCSLKQSHFREINISYMLIPIALRIWFIRIWTGDLNKVVDKQFRYAEEFVAG